MDQELFKSGRATGLPDIAKEVVREPPPNADTVFQLYPHPIQDKEANAYSHGVDYLTACAEEYNLASLPKQKCEDPLPYFISPLRPCDTLNMGSWLHWPWGEGSVKGCQWQADCHCNPPWKSSTVTAAETGQRLMRGCYATSSFQTGL